MNNEGQIVIFNLYGTYYVIQKLQYLIHDLGPVNFKIIK